MITCRVIVRIALTDFDFLSDGRGGWREEGGGGGREGVTG